MRTVYVSRPGPGWPLAAAERLVADEQEGVTLLSKPPHVVGGSNPLASLQQQPQQKDGSRGLLGDPNPRPTELAKRPASIEQDAADFLVVGDSQIGCRLVAVL